MSDRYRSVCVSYDISTDKTALIPVTHWPSISFRMARLTCVAA